MERLKIYQKDTMTCSGSLFDNENNPLNFADKEVLVLIVKESNPKERIEIKGDAITIVDNTMSFDITSEMTEDMIGNYVIQITINNEDYSVREIKRFINVSQSF
jgi:hypothetical protein